MKKTRIIAAALMAAVISAGAGYAAWTDTLNINSTASTGKMNVEFTTTKIFGQTIVPNKAELGPYLGSTLDQTTKVVNVSLSNLYPGSGLLYAVQYENKGSIPVKIESVEVKIPTGTFADEMKDALVVVGGYTHWRNGRIIGGGILPGLGAIEQNKYHLKDLQTNLNTLLAGTTMEVGDVISLDIPEEDKGTIKNLLDSEGIEGFNPETQNCIVMGLPKGADSDNTLMSKNLTTDQKEQKSINFQIKFNFKQFNK
ncbi:hypothetical protein NBE98_13130 [Clostridium swellfunianum]|uniref:hypothetical protein n=1 Tax=Clostridium swellfunianum TaxID=1367462 RepID=UPI00202F1C1D|nr:hypothetical protein [Clostridium swellfunianum]MCM0649315.1 hypothetical protein [Clostridium swellfunianum]